MSSLDWHDVQASADKLHVKWAVVSRAPGNLPGMLKRNISNFLFLSRILGKGSYFVNFAFFVQVRDERRQIYVCVIVAYLVGFY